MHFLDFVLRNLFRRRVRTALTIVGVSIAISAVVALVSITSGYERSSKDVYASHGVDMVIVRAGVANNMTSTLDEKLVQKIETLPGVAKVAVELSDQVSFEKGSLKSQPVKGWPPESFAFDALTVIPPGKFLMPGGEHEVMLGKALAKELDKKLGDEVQVEEKNFKVVGIFESGNMVENSSAIVSLHDLQDLMERDGQVTQLNISLAKDLPDRKAAMLALREQIETLKDADGNKFGLKAQETDDFVRNNTQLRLAHAMAWVTSAIALIVGSIGMLNTMIVSVLERTQEIGILRAIGWKKRRIVRMIMIESFTLSFVGRGAGNFAGLRDGSGVGEDARGARFCARRRDHASRADGLCAFGGGWIDRRCVSGDSRRKFAADRSVAI